MQYLICLVLEHSIDLGNAKQMHVIDSSSDHQMPSGARPIVVHAPEVETRENATARVE
jgi:hypothetical protein